MSRSPRCLSGRVRVGEEENRSGKRKLSERSRIEAVNELLGCEMTCSTLMLRFRGFRNDMTLDVRATAFNTQPVSTATSNPAQRSITRWQRAEFFVDNAGM
jgi:hypothetical protein